MTQPVVLSPLLIPVKSISCVYPRCNDISSFALLVKSEPTGLDDRAVCGLLVAGLAGSNPAEGMGVRLLCLLCVVQVAACRTK